MNTLDILQRASLFGLAALAIALLLQWLLANRVPAHWRVWIWRIALIQTALALIPLAPLALAILPARAPIAASKTLETPAPQTSNQAPVSDDAPAAAIAPDAATAPVKVTPPAMEEAPDARDVPVARPRYAFNFKSSWRDLALWIYGFGVALQLAMLCRNIVRVRRALRNCAPLDNSVLRSLAERLAIRRLPRLFQSASGSPFLVGILRPTIVVPQTLSSAHLEAVLAHELAHLRRKDLAWNALLWLLQTLLWFHPLTLAARRFHALEVESACDELTLQTTRIAPKSYGALLVNSMNKHNSPLTAGVNDGFFALQTRLARLGRAPVNPRKRMRWAFGLALLVSFAAVVPIRLTARAQNEAKLMTQTAGKTQTLRGTVRDVDGKPVADATVYIMESMDNGGDPRAQTQTDANGKFALDKLKIDQYGVVVFVDAGRRGVTEKQFDLSSADGGDNFSIKLPQTSFVNLLMSDKNGRRIKGVAVQLGRVGNSLNSWMAMPRAVKARYRATTDAVGTAVFPPLPRGMVAQFMLSDQISKPTKFGLGDLRGGKYAPLAAEDAVRLERQGVMRGITLLRPIRLQGQVSLSDGQSKGNVLILARRINAAEAAGQTQAREQLIAQTRSNAQGKYVMDGLRPGHYYVWVYPEKQLVKEFIGPSYERDLTQKTNRVDFPLSRGALVQGVVVAKNTGKPVKGQTMWLFDSQENNRYVITDARGYFKFRALGGKQRLRVHENGSNSPPPGFSLPAQSEFNFTIKNGEKRDFKIALPGQAAGDPIGGIVLNPDGTAAAGATVNYRTVGSYGSELEKVMANAEGKFELPARASLKLVQLFADKGELATPQSVIARKGRETRLQLATNGWSAIAGRVVDEKKQPVAGVKIKLAVFYGTTGFGDNITTTDANGNYAYQHLHSGIGAQVTAFKSGYTEAFQPNEALKSGETARIDLTLQRAPLTLSGVLYGTDGKPARNYQAWVSGLGNSVKVGSDGRFFFPHVTAGEVKIRVASQGNTDWGEFNKWKPFSARGGDKNVVLRLSERQPDPLFGALETPKSEIKPESLIGAMAPPIQATRWSSGRALALAELRGRPVLLAFDAFRAGGAGELRDFARAFPEVQIVGVQLTFSEALALPQLSANEAARTLGFPIAVDAALPTKKLSGWRTAQSYGKARYVAIGRTGKVIYAGDKLDRALALANASADVG